MTGRTAAWEDDVLVLRLPFAEFEEALALVGAHGGVRHRVTDRNAFKAHVVASAFKVSRFDGDEGGQGDHISEWIDALVAEAVIRAAGVEPLPHG